MSERVNKVMYARTSLALGLALAWALFPLSPRAARAQEVPADPSGRMVIDRVVAVVDSAVILNSELMRRVVPLAADVQKISDVRERRRRMDKLAEQVLEEMINEELIVQAAVESKLEVSAVEVQNALDEIKNQNNLDDDQLAEALHMQGYSMAGYRKDLRRQILRMRAVRSLVQPRVTVTDDDVRARYDAMNRRSSAVSEVYLRHILIALPEQPTDKALADVKEKAARIIERARAGEDFAALAQELSDDPSTKASGGDLGWIERGSIATEWEVIVFGMSKGETRGPVNGPRGLHVFHVDDVKKNESKPFEEVKESLRNELFRVEMDRQTRQWLEELRKKAHIETKL